MKKVLIAILVLMMASTSFAQRYSVGAKGGVNFSNFTGGDFKDVDKKMLVGFHLGGYLNLGFGDNLSLQPEALFSTQGVKIKDAGEETDLKVSYINIPVLLKYKSDGGFYIEAGPQVGFKVSEDVGDNSMEDFAKGLDLSLAGGLGFQSKGPFGIGARYTAGISKVGDFDAGAIDPDFKNSVIQVSIYFKLF